MLLSQYDLNKIRSHKSNFRGNKLFKKQDIPVLKKQMTRREFISLKLFTLKNA